MDAKLKADWVKALRSGEYEQYRGSLYYDQQLCCLGVLWHISGRPEQLNDLWHMHLSGHKDHLIFMNDDAGKSFSEIADYIEQNL